MAEPRFPLGQTGTDEGNRDRPKLGYSEGRGCLFYITTLDYSRNKEAKVVPIVKRQAVVGGSERGHYRLEGMKNQKDKNRQFRLDLGMFHKPLAIIKKSQNEVAGPMRQVISGERGIESKATLMLVFGFCGSQCAQFFA